jgi:hypothetical protein
MCGCVVFLLWVLSTMILQFISCVDQNWHRIAPPAGLRCRYGSQKSQRKARSHWRALEHLTALLERGICVLNSGVLHAGVASMLPPQTPRSAVSSAESSIHNRFASYCWCHTAILAFLWQPFQQKAHRTRLLRSRGKQTYISLNIRSLMLSPGALQLGIA